MEEEEEGNYLTLSYWPISLFFEEYPRPSLIVFSFFFEFLNKEVMQQERK